MMQRLKTACHIHCLLGALALASGQLVTAQSNGARYMNYAQKVLQDTLGKHPEVVIMAFHVTPPGGKTNVIIASNIGRIGKEADDDDLRVIQTEKSNLEVNSTGVHFEDECVLRDKDGHNIGAVGIVFNYKAGDDQQKLAKAAEAIRDEMSRSIPNKVKLFEQVP